MRQSKIKGKIEGNKKSNIYSLTQKGKTLLPVILELMVWSDTHLNDHLKDGAKPVTDKFKANKTAFINHMYTVFEK